MKTKVTYICSFTSRINNIFRFHIGFAFATGVLAYNAIKIRKEELKNKKINIFPITRFLIIKDISQILNLPIVL